LAFFGDLLAAHLGDFHEKNMLVHSHTDFFVLTKSSLLVFYFKSKLFLGHDGGHFAVSHYPIINDVTLWGMSIVSNPIIWQQQHTYGHHGYTNQTSYDPDLHHFNGLIQLQQEEQIVVPSSSKVEEEAVDEKVKLSWIRRTLMYSYCLLLFSLSTLGLTIWGPTRFIIDRSMFGIVEWTDRQRWLRTMGLFLHWISYTILIMFVPFYVHKTTAGAIASILIHVLTSGLLFGLVTQVGHVSEYTLNRSTIQCNRRKRHPLAQNSWAAEQIEHSNNFCSHSILWFVLAGGLGLQIEHHLFPSMNHCHLMKIQPIVEQTCQEYNVAYKQYSTWWEAISDTLHYVTQCSVTATKKSTITTTPSLSSVHRYKNE
jgi:fatty acid desaturase